jgi:GDPmannose 4,6-dehydratase
MKKKLALITGVSGQDGSYLAEFLLKKNYNVVGADRRSSRSDMWRLKRLGISDKIINEEIELTETYEITRLLKKYKFNEIYNLAAQSFVTASFNSPISTSDIKIMRLRIFI